MSQPSPVPESKERTPPEERFWKRYSPHHEFPLSSVGSVVLHVLAVGTLIVLAYVLTRTGGDERIAPPSISVVALPDPVKPAAGGAPDSGVEPEKREAGADRTEEPSPDKEVPEEGVKLKDISFPKLKIEPSPDGGDRLIAGAEEDLGNLGQILQDANDKLKKAIRGAPPKQKNLGPPGDGRPGPGGGGPPAELRQKRQVRWKLLFSTAGGEDYLKQMRDLGAILGLPRLKGDGQVEYLVIRDIERNAVARREDVSKLNRMFWFDKEPGSVLSVSRALGLRTPPPFFVAFFPEKLEKHLRQLEQQAYSGDEERIAETRFRVVNRDGVYQVELDPVNPVVLKR